MPWTYDHRTRALLYADNDATIRFVMAIGKLDASYCPLYNAGMAHDDLEAFYRLALALAGRLAPVALRCVFGDILGHEHEACNFPR